MPRHEDRRNFLWMAGITAAAAAGTTVGARASVPDHFSQRLEPIVNDPLNVLGFGVVPGDDDDTETGAKNAEAFTAAIQQAQQTGRTLFVPAGRYLLLTRNIVVSESLEIVGAGKDRTVIKLGDPESADIDLLSATFPGIQVTQPDRHVAFRHLTLEGPLDNGLDPDTGEPWTGNLVDSRSQHGDKGTLLFEECRLRSGVVAIKTSFGGPSVEVHRCDIRARTQGILMVETSGAGVSVEGFCHVFDSTFEMEDDSLDGDHCIYVNDRISLWVDGCRFFRPGGVCIKMLRGDSPGPGLPEYARIENSYFELGEGKSAIITHHHAVTQISDCTFDLTGATGIRVSNGGATIAGWVIRELCGQRRGDRGRVLGGGSRWRSGSGLGCGIPERRA